MIQKVNLGNKMIQILNHNTLIQKYQETMDHIRWSGKEWQMWLKNHFKRKANLVFKNGSKINLRGRRNLDHPTVRNMVEHQNYLFMKKR